MSDISKVGKVGKFGRFLGGLTLGIVLAALGPSVGVFLAFRSTIGLVVSDRDNLIFMALLVCPFFVILGRHGIETGVSTHCSGDIILGRKTRVRERVGRRNITNALEVVVGSQHKVPHLWTLRPSLSVGEIGRGL